MKPLLAATCKKLSDAPMPCFVSPKLDGIRCLIRSGTPVSRSLKNIRNKHVQELLRGLPNYDGELIVGEPTAADVFAKTSSGVMSAGGRPQFVYHVFDFWDRGTEPYETTLTRLENETREWPEHIQLVPHTRIESEEKLAEFEQWAVVQGLEGIMIRSCDGKYKFGRSTLREGILSKMKRYDSAEGVVIGFTELRRNNNEATTDKLGHTVRSSHKDNLEAANTLGALILKLSAPYEGDTLHVGSGFDAATREQIWENKTDYLGAIVTFKFGPSTKDLPRFPIFQGFRHKDDSD